MGLKIFAIILILFIAEITFLSTKEHKVLKAQHEDVNYSTIEFTQIQGSSISTEGIYEKIAASKAFKFKDHDELYDIHTSFHDTNLTHTLTAQKAYYKEGHFYLSRDVLYENNQSMQIKSQELEYNIKTKVVQSPSAFIMSDDKGTLAGDSFVYDMHTNHIKGQKLHYSFEVEE